MARDTRCRPAARSALYRFERAGLLDAGSPIADGTLVYKTQPYGCPRNGTMGQCYVADAETGRFLRMVNEASLVRAGKLPAEVRAYGGAV